MRLKDFYDNLRNDLIEMGIDPDAVHIHFIDVSYPTGKAGANPPIIELEPSGEISLRDSI